MKRIVLDFMRRYWLWFVFATAFCAVFSWKNIPFVYVVTFLGAVLVWFDLQSGASRVYASLPISRGHATAALWLCAVVLCPLAYGVIALITTVVASFVGHDTGALLGRLPLVVLWCMGWAAGYFLLLRMAPEEHGLGEQILSSVGGLALMSPMFVMAFLMSETVNFGMRGSTGLPDLFPLLPSYAVPLLSAASILAIVLSYVLRGSVLERKTARKNRRSTTSSKPHAVTSTTAAFLKPWQDCAIAAISRAALVVAMFIGGYLFFQHVFSKFPGSESQQDLASLTGPLAGAVAPLFILIVWQPRSLSFRALRALPMSHHRLTAYVLSFPALALSLWLLVSTPLVLVLARDALFLMLSYAGLGSALSLLALPLFMHIRFHVCFAFGWFGLVVAAVVLVGLTSPLVAAILAVPLGILGVALIHYLLGTCGGYRPMLSGVASVRGL
jgi:hypothetical protein